LRTSSSRGDFLEGSGDMAMDGIGKMRMMRMKKSKGKIDF